ncbi:MAG: RIP metalloprotease RseP [Clostridia bacterium]|nr:RIP metalloprotease RseP [Clostridia bacterium]
MVGVILSILKIIILLGFLIFIHEFGHFTVAKLCKVKVNEFAIGFGPIILKKQYKETKYELRLIPLGGFVSMEGESQKSEDKRSFSKVKIPKRIAIVAAGGLVNIIFALAVFFCLQLSTGENVTTKVESTIEGYAAESIGIKPGDIIRKVNGKKVVINTDVNEILDNYSGGNLVLTIEREGNIIEKEVTPSAIEYYSTGIFLEGEDSTKVQGFSKKDSVEQQGFKIGDTIISVDGVNIENDANKLTDILQENNQKESFTFVVRRLGKEVTIQTTPIKKTMYYLGVVFSKEQGNFFSNVYYSSIKTGRFAFSIVDNLKQLISGNVSTSDFMGPVGISKAVARTDGIQEFISMLALISLSLGVTNLLPFPPLDGGKIVLLIIEAIRKKPLDEKYEVGIQMVGFGLMIMLSLYVTYHDILRII